MPGFYLEAIEAHLPQIGLQRLKFIEAQSGQSIATVMIGRNGSGKSTILREIVLAFRALADLQLDQDSDVRTSWSMMKALALNGNNVEWIDEEDIKRLRKLKREGQQERHLLPSKVIALSFTPFDKFPYPNASFDTDGTRPENAFYIYLGFKTEARLISARGRLFRTLEGLISSSSELSHDARVSRTLSAIGYRPALELSYGVSPNILQQLKDRRDTARSALSKMARPVSEQVSLLLDAVAASPVGELLTRKKTISLNVNFETGVRQADFLWESDLIRDCLKLRILQIKSVYLRKINDSRLVDLLELSSGELNILTGFLGLAAHLEDNALVLIDEPENSLHPEWQIRYTEMMHKILSEYRGCHYIIATHSPLVVSGAAEIGSYVVRLDQSPTSMELNDFASESPDATLINAFDVVTSGNNYIKQLVLEALTLVDQGLAQSQRSLKIVATLMDIQDQIPIHDPIRELVSALLQRTAKNAS